jgi:RHS repeat-associated protein
MAPSPSTSRTRLLFRRCERGSRNRDPRLVGASRRYGPLSNKRSYRDDGLRAWKQDIGDLPTYGVYDGDQLLYELYDTQDGRFMPRRCFGYGAAGLEQQLEEAIYVGGNPSLDSSFVFPDVRVDGLYTFLYDPAGNTSSIVTPSDLGESFWFYDAFGQLLTIMTPDYWGDDFFSYHTLPVGFGGQWGYYTDADNQLTMAGGPTNMGLILLGRRYYDPATGRFLTRDPIGYEGGFNVYAYTENNPVNAIDPTGLRPPGPGSVDGRGSTLQRRVGALWARRHAPATPVTDRPGTSPNPTSTVPSARICAICGQSLPLRIPLCLRASSRRRVVNIPSLASPVFRVDWRSGRRDRTGDAPQEDDVDGARNHRRARRAAGRAQTRGAARFPRLDRADDRGSCHGRAAGHGRAVRAGGFPGRRPGGQAAAP